MSTPCCLMWIKFCLFSQLGWSCLKTLRLTFCLNACFKVWIIMFIDDFVKHSIFVNSLIIFSDTQLICESIIASKSKVSLNRGKKYKVMFKIKYLLMIIKLHSHESASSVWIDIYKSHLDDALIRLHAEKNF